MYLHNIVMLMFITLTSVCAIYVAFSHSMLFRTFCERRFMDWAVLEILYRVVNGHKLPENVFIIPGSTYWTIIDRGGIYTMGDHYRRYIGGLPLKRKHEILDTLLKNAQRRLENLDHKTYTDLPKLISSMHQAEIETIAQITLAGNNFEGWEMVALNLPDAIILFRLSQPSSPSSS